MGKERWKEFYESLEMGDYIMCVPAKKVEKLLEKMDVELRQKKFKELFKGFKISNWSKGDFLVGYDHEGLNHELANITELLENERRIAREAKTKEIIVWLAAEEKLEELTYHGENGALINKERMRTFSHINYVLRKGKLKEELKLTTDCIKDLKTTFPAQDNKEKVKKDGKQDI